MNPAQKHFYQDETSGNDSVRNNNLGPGLQVRQFKIKRDSSRIRNKEKLLYQRQLHKLSKLKKMNIKKDRFD